MKTLDALVEKAFSRRSFLVGSAAATLAATTGCSPVGTITTTTGPYSDTDVLNYALNLEYLEAEFYLRAATGSGLAATDVSAGSASPYQTVGTVNSDNAQVIPGMTTLEQEMLNEIAYEEQQHVRFLRSALGSAAVPRPDIDLYYFGPLAIAAGFATTGGAIYTPFDSFDDFLVGAFLFEDVGVTAYTGAAPLISSAGVKAGYLTAAAGILAVEGYHAGYIRSTLTARAIAAGTAQAYPYLGYANQIEALRATLTVGNTAAPSSSGSVETLLTLPMAIGQPSAVVPASASTAIGFARTVNQVHHIVYGSATVGVSKGGFFPNGTNSIFATTTA